MATVISIANTFEVSHGLVLAITERVCHAMIEQLGAFTRWPEPSERARLRDCFRQITGLDNGVIGAIDGTHIPFLQRPKTDNADAMYTYKRRYAFVVQGVADCNVQIRTYFIMSTASIHDAAVYRKSPLCSFPSAFFGPDEFLLKDAAYPCGEHPLTPFSGRSVFSDPQIADFFNEHHGAGRVFLNERGACSRHASNVSAVYGSRASSTHSWPSKQAFFSTPSSLRSGWKILPI